MWVLAVVVTVIWGAVIYRIVDAVSQGDTGDAAIQETTKVVSSKETHHIDFSENVKDPFEFRSEVHKKVIVQKDTTAKVAWTEPPFKLVGIMQKNDLTTAVLQRDDGVTFFVRKGDTLAGLKVLTLDQQTLEYMYRNQKNSWKLTPGAR
jgi:Tfp pilus assembly protein PilP